VAGTLVHTDQGLKKIEEIESGDRVLTRSEHDSEGPIEYRAVRQTFITHPNLLLHITFSGLDGREETLVTTAAHPFFTLEAQAFVDAQDLELGDVFRLASGETAVVLAITHEQAPDGETFTTYNFEVEECHTYFVGEQGVWVHNTNEYLICTQLAAAYEKDLAKGMDAAKARLSSDNYFSRSCCLNRRCYRNRLP